MYAYCECEKKIMFIVGFVKIIQAIACVIIPIQGSIPDRNGVYIELHVLHKGQ